MVSLNAIREQFAMKLARKPQGLSMEEFDGIVSEFIDMAPSDDPATEMQNAMSLMSAFRIYEEESIKAKVHYFDAETKVLHTDEPLGAMVEQRAMNNILEIKASGKRTEAYMRQSHQYSRLMLRMLPTHKQSRALDINDYNTDDDE